MKSLIRIVVSFFIFIVDVIYGDRSYPRFYVLETIARWLNSSLVNNWEGEWYAHYDYVVIGAGPDKYISKQTY